MREELKLTMEDIYTLINSIGKTNVIVQIQSYGRIYVYDDCDYIQKENAIKVSRDDNCETIDELIKHAYYEYYKALCVIVQNNEELNSRLENGSFEGKKLTLFNKACKMLIKHVKVTEPLLTDYHIGLKVSKWMRNPNTHFMGESPNEIIEKGQGRKVIGLLEQIL